MSKSISLEKSVFCETRQLKWNISFESEKNYETKMSTCETDYLEISNSLISKYWNMLFKKWATEIVVHFMKQASEKKNIAYELWNGNHKKWIIMYQLWNWLF